MKKRKKRVLKSTASATMRQKLGDIENISLKQKRQNALAGRIVKKENWKNHKLSKKPSKDFQIHLITYPLLHARNYSKQESERLRDYYNAQIQEVKRNPNSVLVIKRDAKHPGVLKQEIKNAGLSSQRVFEFKDTNSLKKVLKKKQNVNLYAMGEVPFICSPRYAAKMAEKLGLKPRQINFKLEEEYLSNEGFTYERQRWFIDTDHAYETFVDSYGKVSKKDFMRMFNTKEKLKKLRLHVIDNVYKKNEFVGKDGEIKNRPGFIGTFKRYIKNLSK